MSAHHPTIAALPPIDDDKLECALPSARSARSVEYPVEYRESTAQALASPRLPCPPADLASPRRFGVFC